MTEPTSKLDDALYAPISAAEPCGPALERYEFADLTELCDGKEARYDPNRGPDEQDPPQPPNYPAAEQEALRLLERTRDLRPLTRMAQIGANLRGAPGLHAALHLFDHVVENMWDDLHPGPASAPEAMSERRRAVQALTSRGKIVNGITRAPIFRGTRNEGDITLDVLRRSAGVVRVREGQSVIEPPAMREMIAAADASKALEDVQTALTQSAELMTALAASLAEKFDAAIALAPIAADLTKLAEVCGTFLGDAPAEDTATLGPDADGTDTAPTADSAPQKTDALPDHEAAQALLEDVIGYFARTAPSSPVALILLRVHELRDASFNDWNEATGASGAEKAALDISTVEQSRLTDFADAPAEGAEAAPADAATGAVRQLLSALTDQIGGAVAVAEENPEIAPRLQSIQETLEDLTTAVAALPEPAAPSRPAQGRVTSRAEVKTALDRLADFHDRQDPGSAVFTILKRTKSLVDLRYLDILEKLSPSGGKAALRLNRDER